jgi:oligopeptidase B
MSDPGRPTTPFATPPIAARRPHVVASPHGNREDEYYWLRDDSRQDAAVLAYLRAEDDHRKAALAHLGPLKRRLYEEIVGRIKQDDASVPYRKDGWWYYARYETGHEYPIHARRRGSPDAPEEVLLDVQAMAQGREYFAVDDLAVSPDGRLLAWAEDAVGRGQYVLRVRDLDTGEILPERIPNAEARVEWAADNRTFIYVEQDPQTLLGYRVRRHLLGTDPAADALLWEQQDESFYTDIGRSKDDRYLFIDTRSTLSSETWYADAADPALAFCVFLPREREHEYHCEHFDGRWIVRTNWRARNFRIVEVAFGDERRRDAWRDLVPHDPHGFVHGFDVFRSVLAVEERSGGLRRVRLRRWTAPAPAGAGTPATTDTIIPVDEPSGTMRLGDNEEVDSDVVRYEYTSLTTPRSTYDLDVATGTRTLLKREPVVGGHDPADYVNEFAWAEARDGARIPVSIVRRRSTPRDGTAPLLQYGYGAYGATQEPAFSVPVLSLLDRGFVYAVAHVRGGQELGRSWYESGRQFAKWNTFSDFVDATRWLVANRYADPRRVFARGGSAGGLLMGVIANEAPQDYRGIVSLVPFVDIVTTMLDETIPLTTNEYDEWGDPRQQRCYEHMLSYSPYDNLRRGAYPAMYVATGLWDSQVQYWEPVKYVARLRARRTNDAPLVLRVNLEAGHGGRSGRLQHYEEIAEEWAFLLDLASASPRV